MRADEAGAAPAPAGGSEPGAPFAAARASGGRGGPAGAGGRESAAATSDGDAASAGADPEGLLARAGGENFPVASRLLPRRLRAHLLALYGYARLVDWAGDEAEGDRLALLDAIERDVDRVFAGDTPRHPLLQRLAPTVEACALPAEPLRGLIEANRRDQRQHRYETFEALLGYCALSANPVGRLVLHVFGAATPERVAQSDAVCTALQLAEHWQDVAEDARAGRVYLPQEDLARFGCAEEDLRRPPPAGPALRRLLAFEVKRARRILHSGAPLAATLRGRPRLAVAGFVAGGQAALDAIERRRFDVLAGPPRPRRRDLARRLLATLRVPPAPAPPAFSPGVVS